MKGIPWYDTEVLYITDWNKVMLEHVTSEILPRNEWSKQIHGDSTGKLSITLREPRDDVSIPTHVLTIELMEDDAALLELKRVGGIGAERYRWIKVTDSNTVNSIRTLLRSRASSKARPRSVRADYHAAKLIASLDGVRGFISHRPSSRPGRALIVVHSRRPKGPDIVYDVHHITSEL